ncbi:uncharacterized protein LOC114335160 [Diabrotica virgifera virgifera]|uniref:Ku70/Ku80 N-terminal alpha/beta domain-containing protein n=1 Tax=Diabrotica virgifera virgifera TaxID=50390 RepID=A0ABM5IT46_DIAVI|nr:uncharacterized protein LOC114335160 [Diabrotica virgifera virgifera]
MYEGDEYGSDYEEGDSEIFSSSFKPSYVIVAIDTHPCMFKKKSEKEQMPFRICLEALAEVMETLIFKKDTRMWSPFAVVLAGAATPLISFNQSVLDTVKFLQVKCRQTDAELTSQHQRKTSLNVSSFFLTCKKLFHEIKSVFHKRTLLYLSNDDKPVTDKNARFTAFNEIKTFAASQIEFQIIPTIQDFQYKLFYNELFSIIGNPKREEICTDKEGLAEKLSSLLMVSIMETRILFYPFPDDTERYLKCKRFAYTTNIQLYNQYMTKDGKKVINTDAPPDDQEYFRLKSEDPNQEHMRFDALEKERLMDSVTPKGLTLAFVGDRQIGYGHTFFNTQILKVDPTETLPYFNKFWDHCVNSKKVLVCLSKLRQPDRPRYVELIPVLCNGQQMFLEKRLPFGNEIVMPFKYPFPLPEEEVDDKRKLVIEQLVEKLTFDFNLKMLPDVNLQKKKAYIKAKLLDIFPEPVNNVEIDSTALDGVLEEVVAEIQAKFQLTDTFKRKAPQHYNRRNKRGK